MNLIFLVLLASVSAFAGQDVGSGGDLIKCEGSQYNGYYSLDYLVLNSPNDPKIVPIKNLDSSLKRIEKNLEAKLPELLPTYKDFRFNLFSDDFTKYRFWEKTPNQLIDVKDESLGLSDRIPNDCKKQNKVYLSQAVIRLNPKFTGSGPGTIIYRYMPDLVQQTMKASPLQVSYLLVHEWLWDHTKNVEKIRRINNFFHSKDFDRMDRDKILLFLNRMGIHLPGKEHVTEFYGSSCKEDSSGSKAFLARFPKTSSEKISDVKLLERYRYCDDDKNCQPWKLGGQMTWSRQIIDGGLYWLDVRGTIQLQPYYREARGRGYWGGYCNIGKAGTFRCMHKPYVIASEQEYIQINGNVSKNCLRAETYYRLDGGTGAYTHSEYHLVIYSKF